MNDIKLLEELLKLKEKEVQLLQERLRTLKLSQEIEDRGIPSNIFSSSPSRILYENDLNIY